jgi:hypothetical protein
MHVFQSSLQPTGSEHGQVDLGVRGRGTQIQLGFSQHGFSQIGFSMCRQYTTAISLPPNIWYITQVALHHMTRQLSHDRL